MKTKSLLFVLILCVVLFEQCSQPKNILEKPNILLLCVDDLRPELNCYDAQHIISPNIDRFAKNGIVFQNHYVNSPSCGPSRYTLLTGQYGIANNYALFNRAEKISKKQNHVGTSMPEWFKDHGYTTVSVGKVSHHPGGRGGKNWDIDSLPEMPNAWDKHLMPVGEWQHPRGMMHGLAHGEIRHKRGEMDVFQSAEGDDTIYPDGLITQEALKQLDLLANDKQKPFFLAVGLIKPHLPFGAPKKYLDMYENIAFPPIEHPKKPEGKTTWHKSNEFFGYNNWDRDPNVDNEFAEEVRRHYAACVSYTDAQIGIILEELYKRGLDKNTIILLWGDHGWNLGEHAIWGKHNLFEEALHAPLIVQYPNMSNKGSKPTAIIETADIFPTLCELSGIDTPPSLQGSSLQPILSAPDHKGHPAISYNNYAVSVRTGTHRLTIHKDGTKELYDHTSIEKETKNIASENEDLVEKLKDILRARLKDDHYASKFVK